jgi:Na+-translocating ferredoxin:NAD+ oxidoreductase RNF subunit RnfB
VHDGAPSIRFDSARCRGAMACMHACPTGAIRVRGGIARQLSDRCLDCGECVRACPNGAILPMTGTVSDLSRFRHTIAIPSPVLYSQFGRDVTPSAVLRALTLIGFHEACDLAATSESVSIAIQEYLDAVGTPRPLLSPFCPAIVRLIQIRYPQLLGHLIPIDSPMAIAAREARHRAVREGGGLTEQEIGVVYITPCPAKLHAVEDRRHGWQTEVDAAIAICEIYPALLRALGEVRNANGEIHGLGLGWPVLGGQLACLKAEDCLAVGGVTDAVRILDEIENGKLREIQYIELHSCATGCVGGSLTVENPYIARGEVLHTVRRYGGTPARDPARVREDVRRGLFSRDGAIPPAPLLPLDTDVTHALRKLHLKRRLTERLPGIDCGACGAPTCADLAEDAVRGEARTEECVVLRLRAIDRHGEAHGRTGRGSPRSQRKGKEDR